MVKLCKAGVGWETPNTAGARSAPAVPALLARLANTPISSRAALSNVRNNRRKMAVTICFPFLIRPLGRGSYFASVAPTCWRKPRRSHTKISGCQRSGAGISVVEGIASSPSHHGTGRRAVDSLSLCVFQHRPVCRPLPHTMHTVTRRTTHTSATDERQYPRRDLVHDDGWRTRSGGGTRR